MFSGLLMFAVMLASFVAGIFTVRPLAYAKDMSMPSLFAREVARISEEALAQLTQDGQHVESLSAPTACQNTIKGMQAAFKAREAHVMQQCHEHVSGITETANSIKALSAEGQADEDKGQIEKLEPLASHLVTLAQHFCNFNKCTNGIANEIKPSCVTAEVLAEWCKAERQNPYDMVAANIGKLRTATVKLKNHPGLKPDQKTMADRILGKIDSLQTCNICTAEEGVQHIEPEGAKAIEQAANAITHLAKELEESEAKRKELEARIKAQGAASAGKTKTIQEELAKVQKSTKENEKNLAEMAAKVQAATTTTTT